MASIGSTPLSVLDLVPVATGSTVGDALRNSLDLVQHAERLGYRRHWVAEHHNMPGIASSAPAVLIAHLASVTSTVRVGAAAPPGRAPRVLRRRLPARPRRAGRRERARAVAPRLERLLGPHGR